MTSEENEAVKYLTGLQRHCIDDHIRVTAESVYISDGTAGVRGDVGARVADRSSDKRANKHGLATKIDKLKRKTNDVLMVDKMLVRVQLTRSHVAVDYDETQSPYIDLQKSEKWRELIVSARAMEGDKVSLFAQKTRRLPGRRNIRKGAKFVVDLDSETTSVNLYSTLDKTIVLRVKEERDVRNMARKVVRQEALYHLYIFNLQSTDRSLHWYNFLRRCLGSISGDTARVVINCVDLNASLELTIGIPLRIDQDREEGKGQALRQTHEIIRKCTDMIRQQGRWKDIIAAWSSTHKVGLGCRRYDRLEWLHEANDAAAITMILASVHVHSMPLKNMRLIRVGVFH